MIFIIDCYSLYCSFYVLLNTHTLHITINVWKMEIWKYIVKMKIPGPIIYVSAIILLIFTAGVYKQLTQKTANNCEMTFMFEYPHFVVSYNSLLLMHIIMMMMTMIPLNIWINFLLHQEISVPTNRGKYNLYAYTEGQTMDKIKSMKFYGTPVIFIPGHSGSYRQGNHNNMTSRYYLYN